MVFFDIAILLVSITINPRLSVQNNHCFFVELSLFPVVMCTAIMTDQEWHSACRPLVWPGLKSWS